MGKGTEQPFLHKSQVNASQVCESTQHHLPSGACNLVSSSLVARLLPKSQAASLGESRKERETYTTMVEI